MDYKLFDTAVNSFLLDHTLLDSHTVRSVYLAVETGCSYFGELDYPDRLKVGLRVARIGTSTAICETFLFREGHTQAAVAGHLIHMLMDRVKCNPTTIDEISRSSFKTIIV